MHNPKEGPTDVLEHKILLPPMKTCNGCKYRSHQLWRSGRDPIYKDKCLHPDINDRPVGNNELPKPYITSYVPTPDWCPFLKKS